MFLLAMLHDLLMDKIIAAEVRRILDARGIRVGSLAELINLSTAAMQNRLKGVTRFTADDIASMSRVLNVPVGRFFGEDHLWRETDGGMR